MEMMLNIHIFSQEFHFHSEIEAKHQNEQNGFQLEL